MKERRYSWRPNVSSYLSAAVRELYIDHEIKNNGQVYWSTASELRQWNENASDKVPQFCEEIRVFREWWMCWLVSWLLVLNSPLLWRHNFNFCLLYRWNWHFASFDDTWHITHQNTRIVFMSIERISDIRDTLQTDVIFDVLLLNYLMYVAFFFFFFFFQLKIPMKVKITRTLKTAVTIIVFHLLLLLRLLFALPRNFLMIL